MRIIFAGTPEFARVALNDILTSGFDVAHVLTQPDRPAGRGKALAMSPVKQYAASKGIPVFQPNSLRDLDAQEFIRALNADVMVVAAYGLILPQVVLDIPRWGCLNIHASLLPRWRGAAPIQRAIQAGDRQTGVTIMQMEAGLDTGPMVTHEVVPIESRETGASLHTKLALSGGKLISQVLKSLQIQLQRQMRPLAANVQPTEGVTYAHKLEKSEGHLKWNLPSSQLDLMVRAFDPVPGAFTSLESMPEERIKIWSLSPAPIESEDELRFSGSAPPGKIQITDGRMYVRSADNWLEILEIQRPGGKRISGRAFVTGTASLVNLAFKSA